MAPMCPLVRALTVGLWCIPIGMALLAAAGWGRSVLCWVALALPALYSAIWLWCRPSEFRVGPPGVQIRWPLRTRTIRWHQIASARAAPSGRELRAQLGVAIRVGAGGLWGAFGWVWSSRLGWCPVYVSRTRDLVWLERPAGSPLLLSPERPEEFVDAVREWAPRH